MSTLDRPDPAEAWLIAERLLADEELDRLDALTEEQKLAELRAGGRDEASIPSADSLMAGAEKQLAMQQAERNSLSPVAGQPDAEPRTVSMIRATEEGSRVVWLAAAAAILLVLGGAAFVERDAVFAWLRGPTPPAPIEPDHEIAAPPTARELAERARDEAERACAEQHWGACNTRLDQARDLDPAGESEPRVVSLRKAIVAGTTLPPPPDGFDIDGKPLPKRR
jgi:hypothetical protein